MIVCYIVIESLLLKWIIHLIVRVKTGQAQWVMPVFLPLGRPKQVDHLGTGVQDQPGQHSKTLSLQKKNFK